MLKKPMTTEEYFNKVCETMKEKDMMPEKGLLGVIRVIVWNQP